MAQGNAEGAGQTPRWYYYQAKGLLGSSPEAALAHISTCIELCIDQMTKGISPNDVLKAALAMRGSIHKKASNLDMAELDYSQWIELAPQDPIGYSKRAAVYFQKGNYPCALADYKSALLKKLQAADVSVNVQLSESNVLNEAKSSNTDLEDLGEYFYNIGLVYKNMGAYSASHYWFTAALRHKQPFKLAEQNLKLVKMLRSLKTKEALLREIKRLSVSDKDAQDTSSNKIALVRTLVHSFLAATCASKERNLRRALDGEKSPQLVQPPFSANLTAKEVIGICSEDRESSRIVALSVSELISFIIGKPLPPVEPHNARDVFNNAMKAVVIDVMLRQVAIFATEFQVVYRDLDVYKSAKASEFELRKMLEIDEDVFTEEWNKEKTAADRRTFVGGQSFSGSSSSSNPRAPGQAREQHHTAHSKHATLWKGFVPTLNGSKKSLLLDEHQIKLLHDALPLQCYGSDWELAFSTREHGTSFKTFYRNCGRCGPNLLLVKDMKGNVFGAFTAGSWAVGSRHQGTGESFLFTFASGDLEVYRWSGRNEYFLMARDSWIAVGVSQRYGLHLCEDFQRGSTAACDTFSSMPLTSEEDFDVLAVEVWCFTMLKEDAD